MKRKGRTPWPPELSGQLREVDRLRRGGRYAQALVQIRQLAEAHPDQLRVLLEMGLTLGIWGHAPAEALPWFDRILTMAPGHLTTRLHRALTLARLGRHAEAVADFNTVESVGHRKLILYAKRAESLRAAGQNAEAERDWTQALAEDPGNAWLLQQRAQTRALQGRLAEAIQDLTDAIASDQEDSVDPELLYERGTLRGQLGDTAGARADFEAGLSGFREGDPPGLLDSLRLELQRSSPAR
ncbi:Tetratricopeptide repeat-containing protein [Stigmatella aurantiaca]|uniref:Tetratricopeptide repeat-containing protein n=1 Tax=Stigmatella aurantiaca TaxID=41 RepID=A0A1H7FFV2_STIAU|nr:tetratricopeptide repeat protein [Stigmatella aurantiaca]SEK24829.1 Tetratricopeptide repeat-containing protein [Stigmatella aurantiaca]